MCLSVNLVYCGLVSKLRVLDSRLVDKLRVWCIIASQLVTVVRQIELGVL